ncbi:E2-like conjugating enzyme atg10 [Gaertneriomyces sp. JEL0708]|nr:E2-like conjugating enzyme atg10 [Gaertneriomyces sp. JEL0708]
MKEFTPEDLEVAFSELVLVSDSVGDGWNLNELLPGTRACLVKSVVTTLVDDIVIGGEEASSDEITEDDDPSCLQAPATATARATAQIAFHVVYSQVYRCPVLYIIAHYLSGCPLELTELQRIFHKGLQTAEPTKLTYGLPILSLDEHPLLNIPAFCVHPCQTKNFMKEMVEEEWTPLQYLVLWLSMIGTLVAPIKLVSLDERWFKSLER